jgi:hypothetical protein
VVIFLIISFFLGRYERKKLMKKAELAKELPNTD